MLLNAYKAPCVYLQTFTSTYWFMHDQVVLFQRNILLFIKNVLDISSNPAGLYSLDSSMSNEMNSTSLLCHHYWIFLLKLAYLAMLFIFLLDGIAISAGYLKNK